jgi:hypothetical protein
MMAISLALAFGPAIDAARSPDSRVKVKLTTRTVRHTRAASHSLRSMNSDMIEDYDSTRVTASSYLDQKHGDTPASAAASRSRNGPGPGAN